MVAMAIAVGMLLASFVLWIAGLNTLAILVGVYTALSLPSIFYMFYLAIKNHTWPKIVGGPGITWAGKRIGF